MKISLSYNKDFLAGLLLFGFGAMGFYMALDYPFGSSLRMGPGYFPRVLAVILMAFGLFVFIRGLASPERVKGVWGWKALAWIVVSLWTFGFVMEKLGMLPALAGMFVLASAAGHEFKWKEVIILTIVMSTFAVAVFVKGLGLPYPLIEGWY